MHFFLSLSIFSVFFQLSSPVHALSSILMFFMGTCHMLITLVLCLDGWVVGWVVFHHFRVLLHHFHVFVYIDFSVLM